MRILVFLCLLSFSLPNLISAPFATKSGFTGNWEDPAAWDNLPNTAGLSGNLSSNSYYIYGDINRNGDISHSVNIKVYGDLYVDGDWLGSGGSITLEPGANLQIYGNYEGNINFTVETGATLAVFGNYTTTGGTLNLKGDAVVGGDFYMSSGVTLRNEGNLAIGGDYTDINGNLNLPGSEENRERIYILDHDADVNTPSWGTSLCEVEYGPYTKTCDYGEWEDLFENEDEDFIDLVLSVINYTTPCNVTADPPLITDVTCNGGSSGIILISGATGSSAGFEYSIDGGTSWQSSSSFTDLVAGNYHVQIRDDSETSCVDTLNTNLVISEPDPISFTLGNDIVCCEYDIITLDAGAGFESYVWNTGEETQTITPDFPDLEIPVNQVELEYVATITDSDNCDASDSVLVTVKRVPETGDLFNDKTP